ncbi:hypothetical protein ACFE04_013522 [Oxalis oulophora]
MTTTTSLPRISITRAITPARNRQQHPLFKTLTVLNLNRVNTFTLKATSNANEDVNNNSSYLTMWKKAVDRKKKEDEFNRIADNVAHSTTTIDDDDDGSSTSNSRFYSKDEVEKKTLEFEKILQVPKEERDRAHRELLVSRAQLAIEEARFVLNEAKDLTNNSLESSNNTKVDGGMEKGVVFVPGSEKSASSTPGPDFWSWTPISDDSLVSDNVGDFATAKPKSSPVFKPSKPVVEKDRTIEILSIPFESELINTDHNPPLPPLQSLAEFNKEVEISGSSQDQETHIEELDHDVQYLSYEKEAAEALHNMEELSTKGVNPDGSRWWKESGVDQRPDGVLCRWTMIRGVSADAVTQWQNKYWEASDEFGYKELGSEKSGRDVTGSVWREYWKESMWQESGLLHMEKTADKWGMNGQGDEWQEKWWEKYDASGKTEKSAHKWCSIDPYTPLEAGHAHVWHERWGEQYDGHGGSIKYTDKWAERWEGDAWTKWGDKWDENFDPNANGVKQGEAWWEGKYGERWNRTWGEHHNGTGWVHKYGKSSSGEHWDTHVQQDTWYERFPHFGFYHCFDNSVQLREVPKPSELERYGYFETKIPPDIVEVFLDVDGGSIGNAGNAGILVVLSVLLVVLGSMILLNSSS